MPATDAGVGPAVVVAAVAVSENGDGVVALRNFAIEAGAREGLRL